MLDSIVDEDNPSAAWNALRAIRPFFAYAVERAVILTGQRRNEVAGMRWSEIDLDANLWTIPGERTENDQGHIVHLGPQAVDILRQSPRLSDV